MSMRAQYVTYEQYSREDEARDDKIIADCARRLDASKAQAMTDAQLACNLRTYPRGSVYDAWLDAVCAELATRPAGVFPLSAVEQRIRARAVR